MPGTEGCTVFGRQILVSTRFTPFMTFYVLNISNYNPIYGSKFDNPIYHQYSFSMNDVSSRSTLHIPTRIIFVGPATFHGHSLITRGNMRATLASGLLITVSCTHAFVSSVPKMTAGVGAVTPRERINTSIELEKPKVGCNLVVRGTHKSVRS